MRRISRLEHLLGQSTRTPSTAHICRSCQLHAAATTTSASQQQRHLHASSSQHAQNSAGVWKDAIWMKPEQSSSTANKPSKRSKAAPAAAEAPSSATAPQSSTAPPPARKLPGTAKSDRTYVQATTWDGLEVIGTPTWVDRAGDPGDKFAGWTARRRPARNVTEHSATALLRHTAIEAVTLRDNGLDPRGVCAHAKVGRERFRLTGKVVLRVEKEGGGAEVWFATREGMTALVRRIQHAGPVEDEVVVEEGVAEPTQDREDTAWLAIRLDPQLKFVIAKRMFQLTGIRISDFVLHHAGTLRELRDAYVDKQQPTKIFEQLSVAQEIAQMPNVKLSARRITPIDKEKEIGRWKLIEEELIARGLPVTGHTTRLKKSQPVRA